MSEVLVDIPSITLAPGSKEEGISPVRAFTGNELKRVGIAATMLAICGTLIIVGMIMMLGHYNSLANSGPKSVLDGAVIALLIGRSARWRCLALLGIVYGLVILLQIGVFYLFPVLALAGLISAGAGRFLDLINRTTALCVAAATFALVAGFGAPIKIYFGTGGASEPFLWGLWFAEWPVRIAGAIVGVWLVERWRRRPANTVDAVASTPLVRATRGRKLAIVKQTNDENGAAVRIIACLIACTIPMFLNSIAALSMLAIAALLYAFLAGMRGGLLRAMVGVLGAWLVFGALSYAWHRDMSRVIDLSRTLVLRFLPIALTSVVLVATVRPIDMIRLLRKLRISPAVILPLSTVLRSVPHSRRAVHDSIESLRAAGQWNGALSLFLRPTVVFRKLLIPHLNRWAKALASEAD